MNILQTLYICNKNSLTLCFNDYATKGIQVKTYPNQNVPYQNVPNFGQNIPNFGQNIPNFGQNVPIFWSKRTHILVKPYPYQNVPKVWSKHTHKLSNCVHKIKSRVSNY